ncbi:MAG: hypothetical protein KDB69_10345, partial [Acidimicrobiia bacterium]|nr:hypothetical protein [Acidimicrobiia bacterium]
MAVAVQESMTSVDLVTEAVLDVYQSRIEDAAEMTLAEVVGSPVQAGATRAVVVGEDHMVEIVLDDEADPESLIDVAWTLS